MPLASGSGPARSSDQNSDEADDTDQRQDERGWGEIAVDTSDKLAAATSRRETAGAEDCKACQRLIVALSFGMITAEEREKPVGLVRTVRARRETDDHILTGRILEEELATAACRPLRVILRRIPPDQILLAAVHNRDLRGC